MKTKTGRSTTASFAARSGVALLTAAACTAIMVNVVFLQPLPSGETADSASVPVMRQAAYRNTAPLVSEIRVTPADPIAQLVTQGDPMVRQIQTELLRLGYYSGAVDGVAGASTRVAITAYERAEGLSTDGEASRQVLDHILFAKHIAEAASYTASTTPAAPSEDVRRVQKALSGLGFDAGPADGVLGDKTRQAIRAFQAYRGLPATGAIDAMLARELGIVLASEG